MSLLRSSNRFRLCRRTWLFGDTKSLMPGPSHEGGESAGGRQHSLLQHYLPFLLMAPGQSSPEDSGLLEYGGKSSDIHKAALASGQQSPSLERLWGVRIANHFIYRSYFLIALIDCIGLAALESTCLP